MKNKICSIIIVGYNSAPDLDACLKSIFAQTLSSTLLSSLTAKENVSKEVSAKSYEVILVDNASIDNTEQVAAQFMQKHGRAMRYIPLKKNIGFAAGNNVGAVETSTDYLIFVNPDTIVHAGWLDALLLPLVQDERVGMTTSRILHAGEPHLLNACGNDITWTGITVCRGLNEPADSRNETEQVSAVSGASFAMRAELFQQLNGFDERFFMYFEDTDLSNRVRMLGYQILYTPDSILRHKYIFKFSKQKLYYQERNRWLSLLKILRVRTLIILMPGLLIGELMAWAYAAMHGLDHLRAKATGWRWIWHHRAEIMQQREAVYALRQTHQLELTERTATPHTSGYTLDHMSDKALIRHWSPNLRFVGTMPYLPAKLLEQSVRPLLQGYGTICRLLTA